MIVERIYTDVLTRALIVEVYSPDDPRAFYRDAVSAEDAIRTPAPELEARLWAMRIRARDNAREVLYANNPRN